MKVLAIVMLLLLHSVSAYAEEVWLVIGASDLTPAGIALKWKRSGTSSGITVSSRDCGDARNVYVWAPKVEKSIGAARHSLKAVKPYIHDAYIKRCSVRPGSPLAFRESAVDVSIADVPATAVNWDDADRVTTSQPLTSTSSIVISRYYDGKSIEDPLEGRRERVILVRQGGVRQSLEPCTTPEKFTATEGRFAFQCTVAQAGDELLHKVVVYSMKGEKTAEVMHCRTPLLTTKTITCEMEKVEADGLLRLQKVRKAL